jgi:hypothetical protein
MYRYAKYGCDGIVCTNHFNKYIFEKYLQGNTDDEKLDSFFKQFYALKKLGGHKGIDVLFGLEVALGRDSYEHRGENKAEILVYGVTPEEIRELGTKILDFSYEDFYDLSRRYGWLLYQAHPLRRRTKLLDSKYLDGLEVYNGNPRHNNKNDEVMALARERGCLASAGTDYHNYKDPITVMELAEKPKDEKHLVELIKVINVDNIKFERLISKARK